MLPKSTVYDDDLSTRLRQYTFKISLQALAIHFYDVWNCSSIYTAVSTKVVRNSCIHLSVVGTKEIDIETKSDALQL